MKSTNIIHNLIVKNLFAISKDSKHINLIRIVLEFDSVSLHVCEVLLGLLGRGGTQTFVVLDAVQMPVLVRCLPLGELGQRVKRKTLEQQNSIFKILRTYK